MKDWQRMREREVEIERHKKRDGKAGKNKQWGYRTNLFSGGGNWRKQD